MLKREFVGELALYARVVSKLARGTRKICVLRHHSGGAAHTSATVDWWLRTVLIRARPTHTASSSSSPCGSERARLEERGCNQRAAQQKGGQVVSGHGHLRSHYPDDLADTDCPVVDLAPWQRQKRWHVVSSEHLQSAAGNGEQRVVWFRVCWAGPVQRPQCDRKHRSPATTVPFMLPRSLKICWTCAEPITTSTERGPQSCKAHGSW